MNILLSTWSSEDRNIRRETVEIWGTLTNTGHPLSQQEDYTTDEDMVEGVEGKLGNGSGAGGILDLLKASRQVGGPDYAALV